ncbi:6-bladed beta-propeller [bacterium]|nr:6-bladed beta-propeller [bacterium]
MKLIRIALTFVLVLSIGSSPAFLSILNTTKNVYAEETETQDKGEKIIGGGGLPKGLFCSPTYLNVEQQRLYVADSYNNRVQAFIRGNVFQLGFGGFGQNEREFDKVGGIASNNEKIFVVDSANARIQVFDAKGVYLSQFGSFGTEEGFFRNPTDISIDGDSLYVCDTGNSRIQVFKTTGEFVSAFGKAGLGNVEFNNPLGIEVSEGNIFVADTNNHRIQVLDLHGAYQTSFGWQGSEEKAFIYPKGITLYNGSLYVVDSGNHRIQVFEKNGVFKQILSFTEFSSPFGISILDNKILVSDIELNKIFSLELDGRLYGFFGSQQKPDGYFVRPSKVAVSDKHVFVLDAVMKSIQKFDEAGKFVSAINAENLAKAGITSPVSIDYNNQKLYIVDSSASKVAIVSEEGDILSTFGEYGSLDGQFIFPNDISVFGDVIVVCDSGNSRIQIFNQEGKWKKTFGSFGRANGQLVAAKSISVEENAIFVSDSGNSCIQQFDFEGNFIRKMGKDGYELGSYSELTGIDSDSSNKIFIADTNNNRIQILDTITNQSHVYGSFGSVFQVKDNFANATKDYDYRVIPGRFVYPSDVAVFKDSLVIADPFNVRVQMIPFTAIYHEDMIRLTPSYLDFGSIGKQSKFDRIFLIHNEGGSLLEGKITSDNPNLVITPTSFKGSNQEVTVSINGSGLEAGKAYESTITVEFSNQTVKTLTVLFKANESPDFYMEIEPLLVTSADDEGYRIPIKVVPQNGFTGAVTFIALGMPKNTTTEFEPSSVILPDADTVYLKLRPSTKLVEAGVYDIEIEAQTIKKDIHHKASSTFIYKQKTDLVPHTVLGELFTAIWCINCVHSHTAMDRLYGELGKEKVAWIEYYVDSTADLPAPRLAYTESEQRMKWYMSDKGLPTCFFDGTEYLKGVPNMDDDSFEAKARRMYESYREKVIEKSKEPSFISISSRSRFDSKNRKGNITANITALDSIPYKDPRLYFALIESNIPFNAINGDKVHHFVLRDYITPKNDNLTDYLGIPMKKGSGEKFGLKGDTFEQSVSFDVLDIYDINNLSMVVFVQDNVTKRVLQTQVYPVKVINNRAFDLISDGSMSQKQVKGTEVTMTSYIYNNGTVADSYNCLILNKTKEKWLYQTLINGEQKSGDTNGGIKIEPSSFAKVEIKVAIPNNAAPKSEQVFTIQAISTATAQMKTIIGRIDVIESRPPGIKLVVEGTPENTKILAGETLSLTVKVLPDPYFDTPIQLSLKSIPAEILSYEFTVPTGTAPFESLLHIVFKPETPDKKIDLTLLATGDKIEKAQIITINVLKNPDALPPVIDLTYPTDNLVTNKKDLEITGMTDPSVTIVINDKPVKVENSGSFSLMIVLVEGQNVINVLGTNRKGLTTELTKVVTFDSKPPLLEVDEIPEEVTAETLTIHGRTEQGAVIKVGESDVSIDKDGFFEFTITLTKGYNTIDIMAVDTANNSTFLSFDVKKITLIKLRIGSKSVQINEETKQIDAEPYLKSGRTMVPIRFIAEAMQATVEWNEVLKEVTIMRDGKTIRIRIGSKDAYVKEEGGLGEDKVILDAPPEIKYNRTFVPLRFISEILGANIEWNEKLREITIKD